jgi:shikimate kinase
MPDNTPNTEPAQLPSSLPERFFFTGYMGAGKTTVGRMLARHIGFQFIDTDKELTKRHGKSMTQLFETLGEQAFREAELNLIQELSTARRLVISTGGGTLVRDEPLHVAKSSGTIIYLKAPVEVLFERVIFSPKDRPMLDVPNAEEVFTERFKAREPFYRQAHIHVDADRRHPERVINQILKQINPPQPEQHSQKSPE